MPDWNEIDWRTEHKAKQFAGEVINNAESAHPGFLLALGWSGIQALERALMAAWLRLNPNSVERDTRG